MIAWQRGARGRADNGGAHAHETDYRTDPVSIVVELTEASPAAINQNFTFYYAMTGML